MTMPGRQYNGGDFRYGFQGQEKDDEIKGEGNSINYKYRMHDPRIGRFFAVDPLASKYPYYSVYAFSGNRVIDAIELEGLEPAPYKKGAKSLVIVVLGYGGGTPQSQVQSPELYVLLSHFTMMSTDPNIQVVFFHSSVDNTTVNDIAQTIENFAKGAPTGTKVIVGHSFGADNAMEALNDNAVGADLLITLDLSAGPLNDEETVGSDTDLNLVIAYYQQKDSPGDNIIDNKNDKTTVTNIEVNSTHTRIDNDMGSTAAALVQNKLKGSTNKQLIKEAKGAAKTFNALGTAGAPAGTVPAK